MKMRIENVDLEFIAFDSRDVIMTSGGGDPSIEVPTYLPNIWLSAQSVKNYNDYIPGFDSNDLCVDFLPESRYYSFPNNGAYSAAFGYISMTAQDDTPTSGLFVVGKNDKAGYEAVLNWLKGKTSGQ